MDARRPGMRAYVKKHAYGNAGTKDLWAALSEASGKDVAELMDCWTKQMGYPVLKVATDEEVRRCTEILRSIVRIRLTEAEGNTVDAARVCCRSAKRQYDYHSAKRILYPPEHVDVKGQSCGC
eukprot:212401-Pyramimonas_sp.AAC.2